MILLPFTAFGWPEKTRDLDVFCPTSLLITGFDILFFWVARMIMLGCDFMAGHHQGSVPFKAVYIHALVRDADLAQENRAMIERLANVDGLAFTDQPLRETPGARMAVNFEVAIVYEQKIDIAAERERLLKELKKLEGEQTNGKRQLGNEQFLGKAPRNVVDGLRKRAAEIELLIEKIKATLAKLG